MSKLKQTLFSLKDADRKLIEEVLKEKDNEINQLEQQLKQANEIINNPNTLIAQQQELIESLNKQLAENGKQLADKQNTINEINKEFAQAVHDWKALYTEKDKEIEDLKQQQEWYSMWHKKFQKQIEDLTTELETYRPTKLHGNGQCECYKCKQECKQPIHWTDWCNKYKGHIYCDDCLKEILKEEEISQTQLAIQELEKVKVNLKDRIIMVNNGEHSYLQKVVSWYDMCNQINQQIKELKGEK